jgi:hypothetical protein
LKAKLLGTQRYKEKKNKKNKQPLYKASIYITNHKKNIKKMIEQALIEY